jgi:putative Holliday junction resolvase
MNTSKNTDPEIPRQGRLLGIDFGDVRIGLAICDADQTIAGPLATYARRTVDLDAAFFRELVEREAIVGIVVGLPLHLNGRASQKSSSVESFARWLRTLVACPIAFYDERFSTATAEEMLGRELTRKQRKSRIDKIAAQVILNDYLQSPRNSGWQQSLD